MFKLFKSFQKEERNYRNEQAELMDGVAKKSEIISYVNNLVIMSMTGIAQGAQPLIGYYLGKERMDKCKKLLTDMEEKYQNMLMEP